MADILTMVVIAAAIWSVVEHGIRWSSSKRRRRLRPWDRALEEHVRRESGE